MLPPWWPLLLACLPDLPPQLAAECDVANFPPAQNAACNARVPAAVVYPRSPEEVATVLRYARAHNRTLSYRGGGHSYTCKSRVAGSLQLDLRELASVRVDRAAREVTVGTGALFSEIVEELSPDEHAFPRGGCLSVGMGLFLHGGIHAPATRLLGTGNATVRRMSLVLWNGTIVTDLDATSADGDLWRGMRLAGSTLGVVTSLTFPYLDEPEARAFTFAVSLSTPAFADLLLRAIDRVRRDGVDASITFDGAGPARLLPLVSKRYDLSTHFVMVSVRRRRAWVPDALRYARAYAYLMTLLAPDAWPSLPTLVPTFVPIEDLSFSYDLSGPHGWTSSFLCIEDETCDLRPVIERTVDHYRRYAYSDTGSFCWQVFSTLTSFPHKVCFEYNCAHSSLFARELAALDAANKADCPRHTRQYNVPSFWDPDPRHYFGGAYDDLARTKAKYDPHGLLNALPAA